MYKILMAATVVLMLSACSSLQVVEVNPTTGYFPGDKRATVVKSVDVDLDQMKDLVLVPNGDFTINMVKNIGYFNNVINFDDLETIIIKENLTDQVPSINDKIGINKAAKAYKKFLWLRWDSRSAGNNKSYQQLFLIDPVTLEELFVCETYLDYAWSGVNDQANYYPMMNSLIDYIKKNSTAYGK